MAHAGFLFADYLRRRRLDKEEKKRKEREFELEEKKVSMTQRYHEALIKEIDSRIDTSEYLKETERQYKRAQAMGLKAQAKELKSKNKYVRNLSKEDLRLYYLQDVLSKQAAAETRSARQQVATANQQTQLAQMQTQKARQQTQENLSLVSTIAGDNRVPPEAGMRAIMDIAAFKKAEASGGDTRGMKNLRQIQEEIAVATAKERVRVIKEQMDVKGTEAKTAEDKIRLQKTPAPPISSEDFDESSLAEVKAAVASGLPQPEVRPVWDAPWWGRNKFKLMTRKAATRAGKLEEWEAAGQTEKGKKQSNIDLGKATSQSLLDLLKKE